MGHLFTKAAGRLGAAAEIAGRRRSVMQAVAGLVAFGLGFWGWILKSPPHDANEWLNDLFRTLQLITLHFPTEFDGTLPWQLQIGRLAVPIVAFLASFHVILGAITRPMRLALLPITRDHVIFFGAPRLTDAAMNALASRGHRLIFVHPAMESDRLDVLEGLGVTIVTADPFLPSVLSDLGVGRARAVFVATGNDVDAANLAILVVEAMTGRPRDADAPIVAVEFEREDLADELVRAVDASTRNRAVRFHRLSPDREGLSIELIRHARFLADGGDGTRVHALVVGLHGAWEQVLSRLLVGLQCRPDAAPLLTLLLDADERTAFAAWRAARPDLALVAEVTVLAADGALLGDPASRAAWREATPPPRLVVVLRDDADGLASALALRRDVGDLRTAAALVLVRQGREDRILSRLPAASGAAATIPFGGLLREESVERLLDPRAEARAIALHAHYLAGSATLGAGSEAALAAWSELSENLRDANRAATAHLAVHLATIGRDVESWRAADAATIGAADMARLARIEHRRWCADRIDRGWRGAATRDDDARLHPCLVPWDRLSEADRQKDVESVATLLALRVDGTDASTASTTPRR